MDSDRSSGIRCFTNLPLIKGLLKNPGISGTGERLILTNSAAQSMMARISMAALSAPGPKNRKEWISGWCLFREDLMLAFLQIQHGVVYYLLAPFLMLLTSHQFSAKAFFGIVLCRFSALAGPPVMPSGSPVGTTRTFGARSVLGI